MAGLNVSLNLLRGAGGGALLVGGSVTTSEDGRFVCRGAVSTNYQVEHMVSGNWHRYGHNASTVDAEQPVMVRVDNSYRLTPQVVRRRI
jgi:hypothetical protein